VGNKYWLCSQLNLIQLNNVESFGLNNTRNLRTNFVAILKERPPTLLKLQRYLIPFYTCIKRQSFYVLQQPIKIRTINSILVCSKCGDRMRRSLKNVYACAPKHKTSIGTIFSKESSMFPGFIQRIVH